MDNINDNDPVKSLFSEMASDNLKKISKMIRGISEENRLNYLRASNPANSMLINVHKAAVVAEDYEVCATVKALLSERGIQISN
jgi:hypothetical protein